MITDSVSGAVFQQSNGEKPVAQNAKESPNAPTSNTVPGQTGQSPAALKPDTSDKRQRAPTIIERLKKWDPAVKLPNKGAVARDHLANEVCCILSSCLRLVI